MLACSFPQLAHAQLLRVDPVFPTADDTVTITYDARQGNAALVGESPIYPHTGVVTNLSNNNSWRYVKWSWEENPSARQMEALGNDLHQYRFHMRSFYGVPANEQIEQLAFVFRNGSRSKVGRTAEGGDIFYPVYAPGGLHLRFLQPQGDAILSAGEEVVVELASSDSATLTLSLDGQPLASAFGQQLVYAFSSVQPGDVTLVATADNGSAQRTDSVRLTIRGEVQVQALPAGIQPGINYLDDESVVLALFAPEKAFVYAIGDFNNWQPSATNLMKRSPDGTTYWLQIDGLEPGKEYAFQYLVDGKLAIADPYAEKILDPWNDPWISEATYPNLKPYPAEANGIVSVLQTAQQPYPWKVNDFQRPPAEDLVIYELLIRDFTEAHDYTTLIDSLDYLTDMGINAIELMPIMEFEANESWGYNPSFHLAVDKYYGPRNTLKAFIDACHERGVAVILDMVLNHAFGQSPLVQLYWDAANNRPAANSPWFNQNARHPFNVGYDFNHESQATKDFSDRVLRFWLEEYRFDGFRMDLSKGITQRFSADVGQWSAYDASRIALLQRMGDKVWEYDPSAYMILEHFGGNQEEKELADYGFLFWGNLNYNYNEASMGYVGNSDFSWISHQERGWSKPYLVGYMESHDEERMAYRNLQFGRVQGAYNTRSLPVALDRIGMAATFFFPIPGPKLFWQFGELGYDVSIDDPCRVCNKPIRWNYLANEDRRQLREVFSALIQLKASHPVFKTEDFELDVDGAVKRIALNHPEMNVAIFGNFDVTQRSFEPAFQHDGWWYDFFRGDSLLVDASLGSVTYEPGEYHLYTDQRLSEGTVTSLPEPSSRTVLRAFPNPFSEAMNLTFSLPSTSPVRLEVLDMLGRSVRSLQRGERLRSGAHQLVWDGRSDTGEALPTAWYLLRLQAGDRVSSLKVFKAN